MKPNLSGKLAERGRRARAILLRAKNAAGLQLVESLDEQDTRALAAYGSRLVTAALREWSAGHLCEALLATALAEIVHPGDDRDMMVGLARHHVVAQRLGLVPSAVFGEVASRLPDGGVADLLRIFGERTDVTLKAFGWVLAETPEGPDFAPDPPPWSRRGAGAP